MDFLKSYDARTAAETPRPLELRDQQTGDVILIDGQPAIVLVRGASSRSAQAALRAIEIERLKAASAEDAPEDDVKTAEDLHEQICRAAGRFIAGFQNLTTVGADGAARAMDATDIPAFLDLNFISMEYLTRNRASATGWLHPSFAQQVLEFAQDDAAFLALSESA